MTEVRSEVKTSIMISVNSKYLSLCLVSVAIYLMWMDVGFYLELQNLPVREAKESKVSSSPSSYVYSPFQPITIKQLMLPATVQVIFKVFTLHHCILAKFEIFNMIDFYFVIGDVSMVHFIFNSIINL